MSRPSSPTPSGSSQKSDNFIPVTHKKKVRPVKNRKGKNVIRVQRTLQERLTASRVTLNTTGYLEACSKLLKEALRPILIIETTESIRVGEDNKKKEKEKETRQICPTPVCVVCLGLGNITDSSKSRDQYAYLQDLITDLKDASIRTPLIYDPVFREEDMDHFKAAGIEVLLKEHDLIFDIVTLLYMPHCPRSLFDDILRKNWSVQGLKNLVIIGNRLDMYEDPTHPSSTSSAKAPYVVKAVPLFEILPLPNDTAHFDVFNDLALEWIPEEKLLALNEDFWNFVPLDPGVRAEERRKNSVSKKEDKQALKEQEKTL